MPRRNGACAPHKRRAPTSEELRALCAQGVRRLQSEHGFRQWLSAMRTLYRCMKRCGGSSSRCRSTDVRPARPLPLIP